MENKLPKYWVVKQETDNPNWEKVIDYINNTYNMSWLGALTNYYYGYTGHSKHNGTDSGICLSLFKNNPTVLTIEAFMELTNQKPETIKLNKLPKYWVVKQDQKNPDWKKVIDYLNRQSGYGWKGDTYTYYGTEANDKEGVNCYDTLSFFKGNPTVLTIEEFMKLSNQNTVVDFKVKGTKLPTILPNTRFRCVNWDAMSVCNWNGTHTNFVSFGTTTFNNETYILAEKDDYKGGNHYMFLESTLQELAKKENLTNQKSETMVTIKRKELQKIHDIACDGWKQKITNIASGQPFGDIKLSQAEVDEMFKAATPIQLPVLGNIFGKQREELDFRVALDVKVDGLSLFGGLETSHTEAFIVLPSPFSKGDRNKFYLNPNYNWELVDGELIVTRK